MEEKEKRIEDETSRKIVEAAARLALSQGADNVTVRKIIHALNVTNRVFYNRFHNVEEVLSLVYHNLALQMRQAMSEQVDEDLDFFDQMVEIASRTLKLSYQLKLGMNEFIFFQDCLSKENFSWWQNQICRLIDLAKDKDLIQEDLDAKKISYAIWCFIRGYNTDALARGLKEKEAVEGFQYAFRLFLKGLKK